MQQYYNANISILIYDSNFFFLYKKLKNIYLNISKITTINYLNHIIEY